VVACTGGSEAYYSDYKGTPQEFISAVKRGYLYQGQWYKWQKKRRGKPAPDLHPSQFISYIQNHDQVANSLRGKRLHQLTDPGRFRAITALTLLGPATPMLFQGQEFGASTPFYYFADHEPKLAKLVANGRKEFLKQFPSIASAECQALLINPADEQTFLKCKLDFSEREKNDEIYRLHRDLLRLRRDDPVFANPRRGGVDGAVLALEAFVIRFFGAPAEELTHAHAPAERLLIVNFGFDAHLNPAPEPLLAPPEDCQWKLIWSTESPDYGGCGTPPLETEENWFIPAHCAVVLAPEYVPEQGQSCAALGETTRH
jgi:maltooligosyltrehalose trehalohydrolase